MSIAKNILTIDLDYLSNVMNINGGEFIYDEFKFEFIKKLLSKNNSKKIILETHGEVVDYIDTKANIINIDHHHDIYYSEGMKREVDKIVKYNLEISRSDLEPCWIYYLYVKNLINDTWIVLNENSDIGRSVLKHGFKFFDVFGSPFNPYNLGLFNIDIDTIFIIKSPRYMTNDYYEFIKEYLNCKELNDSDRP